MRKPDPTEEALTALRALRESGDRYAILSGLPAFLSNKSGAVMAKAAEMAGNARDVSLESALVEAFRRMFPQAQKRDPGCRALTNIATALLQMEAQTAEVFAKGIRYQQWEASWGPPVDTAAGLRANCAMGLVSIGDPDALLACCDLLSDHAADARIGAVRALGASGRPEAELLLRFKARNGDEKHDVTAETFSALLRLGPSARSVSFTAEFLQSEDDEIAEAAAIALGDSRLPEAIGPLREALNAARSRSRTGTILWALALSRIDEAIELLFEQLVEAPVDTASSALDALALYRADEVYRTRVRKILDERGEPEWEVIWREKWI